MGSTRRTINLITPLTLGRLLLGHKPLDFLGCALPLLLQVRQPLGVGSALCRGGFAHPLHFGAGFGQLTLQVFCRLLQRGMRSLEAGKVCSCGRQLLSSLWTMQPVGSAFAKVHSRAWGGKSM